VAVPARRGRGWSRAIGEADDRAGGAADGLEVGVEGGQEQVVGLWATSAAMSGRCASWMAINVN
jgi:hypothetical protein